MNFCSALKNREFVITAHVNMAEAPDAESLLRQAEILRPAVDAVQLTDSTRMHMSGIAAAALLLQQGIDPIVHMNCRDRNRIALQKDLIGAAALGVSSVLVMRGKRIPDGNQRKTYNVYDLPALEFMAHIESLKQGTNALLNSDFLVGANAEIFTPEADWTPKNLNRKCDAGVNFVQFQICFDMDVLRNYMTHIVAAKLTHRAHFIMALSPLPSADAARWVRDNVKGSLMPESVIDRMDQASDPESEGIEICAELLQEATAIPGLSGANLLTMGSLETIPAAIATSGVRPS
jgi:methylenetetrahydrofolate reductase (NADPH)